MSEQLINLIKLSQNEKKNIKIKKGNKCKLQTIKIKKLKQ